MISGQTVGMAQASETPSESRRHADSLALVGVDGGGTDQTKSNKLVTDPTSDPCDGSDVTTTTTLTPPPPTTTVTDPDTGTGTGACAGNEGTKEQVDVRGCGGWVNLWCNGGCLNIHKVLKHSLPLNQSNFSAYVGASVLRNFPVPCFVAFV